MKKPVTMKHLYVIYKLKNSEFGIYHDKDAQIEKIMKKYEHSGSGSGFGERDISFIMPEKDIPKIKEKLTKENFKVAVYDIET